MLRRKLTEGFRIKAAGEDTWHEMNLPGTAMEVYLRDQIIPDPYVGTNEYAVREFLRNDFVIEGTFTVTEEEFRREHVQLVFYGIDTVSDIFVNDKKAGHTSDMHRTYRFDVKKLLHTGENRLRLELQSALNYIDGYKSRKKYENDFVNTGSIPGFQYLRKTSSMFGWDWGPQLPDAGIWRDVELVAFSGRRLDRTRVREEFAEDGRCRLDFYTDLALQTEDGESIAPADRTDAGIRYQVLSPQGQAVYEGRDPHAEIEKPQLWWPHGYGRQPLYTVKVSMEEPGGERQEDTFRIGLRTLTVSQDPDKWGREFCFKINGQKIFAMGADYIPQDCFHTRVTEKVLERDVKAAVYANFNCLRIWGGGYFQDDAFYDLCDEYGIIIWQDLLFACAAYELYPEFEDNIVKETYQNVRRLRNHACIGLFCGNNELEAGWTEWESMKDLTPYLKRDYLVMDEYLLERVVRKEAPDTFWWPSSPSSGGSFDAPSDESRGDAHYWEVWHGLLPMEAYEDHYFRFLSEFGFQSLPDRKTIRTFADGQDLNLFSEVMESHQKNPSANGKIMSYLSANFRYPKDLDSIGYLSQILQGIAMKSAVDHMRRNRGRCMGATYWQFNDNWPVLSWASMDYYGRFKVLHYMARRFFRSVSGNIQKKGTERTFWLCNETAYPVCVKLSMKLKKMDFEVLDEKTAECVAAPFSSVPVLTVDYKDLLQGRERDVFVAADYQTGSAGASGSSAKPDAEEGIRTDITGKEYSLFVPCKYLHLEDPDIRAELLQDGSLALSASKFAPLCMAEDEEHDVLWDDNAVTFTDHSRMVLHYVSGQADAADHIRVDDIFHTCVENDK